jgi:hypothetical protein
MFVCQSERVKKLLYMNEVLAGASIYEQKIKCYTRKAKKNCKKAVEEQEKTC